MSQLEMTRCTDDDVWASFLERTPQATRYCTRDILETLACEVDHWLVMRNGHPVAGIPVITNNAATSGLPIHSYYVGMMMHDEAWNCKPNRRTENLLSVSGFVMHELSGHYDQLELCLHPDITDVRGFDWFNYHEPEKGRAVIHPRYTARIKLDDDHIRKAARGSRRREENYATDREKLHVTFDGTVDELIHLWQLSLQRQDTIIPGAELVATTNFAQHLLDNDTGVIATTRDGSGSAQTAGLIMFDYNGLAHLPVVGTSETRYGGTMLYFAMMDHAAGLGYTMMDFDGANSPARGYFKHSIGGEATLYFQINWSRPA